MSTIRLRFRGHVVRSLIVFAVATSIVATERAAAQIQLGGISVGGAGVSVGGIGAGVGPSGIGISAGPIGANIGAPGGIPGVGVGVGPGGPGIGVNLGGLPSSLPAGMNLPGALGAPGKGALPAGGRVIGPAISTLRSTRSIEPIMGVALPSGLDGLQAAPASLGTAVDNGLRIIAGGAGSGPLSRRLQIGDRVVRIDGAVVRTTNDLQTVLRGRVAGEDVLVDFERNGVVKSRLVRLVTAEVDAATNVTALERQSRTDGASQFNVAHVDEQGRIAIPTPDHPNRLGDSLGLRLGQGLQVADVTPHGLAARLGVAANDVIVAVNGRAVSSADQVVSLIHEPLVGGESVLTVLRNAELINIPLAPISARLNPSAVDRTLPIAGSTYVPAGAAAEVLEEQPARTGVGTGALLNDAPVVGQALAGAGSGTGVDSTIDRPADIGTGTGAGAALGRVPLLRDTVIGNGAGTQLDAARTSGIGSGVGVGSGVLAPNAVTGDTLTGTGAGAGLNEKFEGIRTAAGAGSGIVLRGAPLVDDALVGTGGALAADADRSGTSAATGAGSGALVRRTPIVGPTLSGTGASVNAVNGGDGTTGVGSGAGTGALLQRAPVVGQTLAGTGIAAAVDNSAAGGTNVAAGGGQGALIQRVPVVGETLAGVGAGVGASNSKNGTSVGLGGGGGAMLGRVPLAGTTAAGLGVGTGATLDNQGLTVNPGLGGGVLTGADQGGSLGGGNQAGNDNGASAGGRGNSSGGNGGITFGAPGDNSRNVGSGTTAGGDAGPSDAQGGIALRSTDGAAQPNAPAANGGTSAGGQAEGREARGGLALRENPTSTFGTSQSGDRAAAGAGSTSGAGQGGIVTSRAATPTTAGDGASAGGSGSSTEAFGGAATQNSTTSTPGGRVAKTESAGGQSVDGSGNGGASRTAMARSARSYSLAAGGNGDPQTSSGGVSRTSSSEAPMAGEESALGGGTVTTGGGQGGIAIARTLPNSGPTLGEDGGGSPGNGGTQNNGGGIDNGGSSTAGGSNAGGIGSNGVNPPPVDRTGTSDDDSQLARRRSGRATGNSNTGGPNVPSNLPALQPGDDLGGGFVYAGSGPGVVGAMFADDLGVAYVSPGSAGAEAGIQAGDRLLGVDGHSFSSFGKFAEVMKASTPGETVQLVVERDGAVLSLATTLMPNPATATYGVDIDGRLPRELVDQTVAVRDALLPLGVQLTDTLAVGYVDPTSRTFAEGVRRGDSVSAINGVSTVTLDDLASRTRGDVKALTADFASDGGVRRVAKATPPAASGWNEVIHKPGQVAVDDGLRIVAAEYEAAEGNSGLRSGDRILVVNAQRVSSPLELSQAVADTKQMHVVVERGDRTVSLVWERREST